MPRRKRAIRIFFEKHPIISFLTLVAFFAFLGGWAVWINGVTCPSGRGEINTQRIYQYPWRTHNTQNKSNCANDPACITDPVVVPLGMLREFILDKETDEETKKAASEVNPWWDSFRCKLEIGDTAIGLLTICLVVIGAYQAYWTYRTLNVAHDTLEKIERAFLFADSLSSEPVGDNRNVVRQWRIYPNWKNSGRTASKHGFNRVYWGVFDDPIPYNFDFARILRDGIRHTEGYIFLGPEAMVTGECATFDLPDLLAAYDRRKCLFVWGYIEYNDVFPGTLRHRTEFCVEVVVTADPSGLHPGRNFKYRVHYAHNGADDECTIPAEPYREPRTVVLSR